MEEDEEDVRLLSCHDDVRKMREFLIHEHGFQKQNILVILDDDGRHHIPTKKLIIDSLVRLCEISEPGDSIFLQFSGEWRVMRWYSRILSVFTITKSRFGRDSNFCCCGCFYRVS